VEELELEAGGASPWRTGLAGTRARGRQELKRGDGDGDGASRSVVEGVRSRAGGRKELKGARLARQDRRRETFGSSSGRPEVCLRVSDASGRLSVAREEDRREGSGSRNGGGVAGEVWRELELEHGRPPSPRGRC
jgi:hypothetical protein